MKQKLKYFILISITVFLEYFRDYLFININLQINFLENLISELSTFNYTDSNLLFLIKSLDIGTLNILKWGLSFLFAFLYFGIGFLISKWFFSHKNHLFFIKLFSLGGLLIMFSSFLIFVIGKSLTFENQMNFYNVSIELSHFVQSSLYPFLFLLVFFANNRTKISARL
tara:strand:+ start:3122 stop:3628 length:507 start_codon:yes stop_codon:yes gene_type:complete